MNPGNTILPANKRCSNVLDEGGNTCNKWLVIEDGQELCMSCDVNKEHDLAVAERVKKLVNDRPVMELTKHFANHSLMNADLKRATLSGYIPENESEQRAKDVCTELIRNFDGRSGLLLTGPFGVGKSHLMAGAAKAVIKWHQKTSIFISLPRLFREIRNTYGSSELSENTILDALEKVDLLVIDDLGAERLNLDDEGTAWAKTKLNEIVDFRVGKSTMYSSNYDADELMEMYGERDFSRILQYAETLQVSGRNRRMAKYEK